MNPEIPAAKKVRELQVFQSSKFLPRLAPLRRGHFFVRKKACGKVKD